MNAARLDGHTIDHPDTDTNRPTLPRTGTCMQDGINVNGLWLGDTKDQRTAGADLCNTACPILDLCSQAYADIPLVFGVVAGVDRTIHGGVIHYDGRTTQDVDVPEGWKRCPACKRELPLDQFGRRSNRQSGVAPYCRPCMSAKSRQYQATYAAKQATKSTEDAA